jgi:hypothetical protein
MRRNNEAPRRQQRGPWPIPVHDTIDQYNNRELRQLAEWVASDGLLRTDEEMVRELFAELPFRKLGRRIRSRLLAVAQTVQRGRGRAG